ncbi:MAG: starch phosphorylase [bacterium]|jgi:starch phosphorylase
MKHLKKADPSQPFQEEVDNFKKSFEERMELSVVQHLPKSSDRDKFRALSYAVRDLLVSKWLKTQTYYYKTNPKRVYYLSLEFLMGRTLGNTMMNLDMEDVCTEAMSGLGYSIEEFESLEFDAGLGNGGLGRLAACFLDSMATLDLPAYGYGIRYEFGMFKQKIKDLEQTESPDNWLRYGNPFEIARTEDFHVVNFGGRVHSYEDAHGKLQTEWLDCEQIMATAYDVPVPGYKTETVNTLRLWSAKATREFNLSTFDSGDYIGAVHQKNLSETISKVLYPNDNNYEGKQLRLRQQYFMVSASIQDIIRRFENCGDKIEDLPKKVAIQLNDTHPSLAIPELMRILLDERGMDWNKAWDIVTKTFAYTNHTVLPEALETWPAEMLHKILPRHLSIIYEINQRFLDEVATHYPGDFAKRSQMSIVQEGDSQQIRMANLAIVGSHSVNGVAELHSKLLKEQVFHEFYEMMPEKFNNKTNGITPRRWLRKANPGLSKLITEKIGDGWVKKLDELKGLEKFADDKVFLDRWIDIKHENKVELAKIIKEKCFVDVNPDSMFDIQVKRIHEYKRQLLNVLHVIHLYNQIKDNPDKEFVPRTVIFGGKAAPGYYTAKLIINLICSVGNIINRDPAVRDLLKVVFIPNYGVSLAEKIMPGADLSEQVSTAGLEASGTGNMKFSLNGALTIGTLDGANIEIKEEVGDENIFIFGKKEEEIQELKQNGYDPRAIYNENADLRRVLDQIRDGYFSPSDPDHFKPLYDNLLQYGDRFFLLVDFQDYIETQEKVSELYSNKYEWHKQGVLNVARMGKFSSDRVIKQYADEIWNVENSKIGE